MAFYRILGFNLIAIQAFEWLVMYYLIYTQENRKIEEILFDHNDENMNQPLSEARRE